MAHTPAGSPRAVMRLSNVEVTQMGQAFRLGKYPIHFHIQGDGSGSYVRSCAIHNTFNRALTVHATNYLTIEDNTAFNNQVWSNFSTNSLKFQWTVQKYEFLVQSTVLKH
jgi:hypothetical protein